MSLEFASDGCPDFLSYYLYRRVNRLWCLQIEELKLRARTSVGLQKTQILVYYIPIEHCVMLQLRFFFKSTWVHDTQKTK